MGQSLREFVDENKDKENWRKTVKLLIQQAGEC